MKISVLTACWNSAATIRHTIDSFFAQDHQDKELVIVDGGSSDDTLSIVRSYPPDQIRLISEPDSGMYDALNKGLHLYTGDAVGVLNSDDTYHDVSVLGLISNALATADIVHGHLNFVGDHTKKRIVRRWMASPRPASGFRSGWMPAHPTFYVRREVADRVGSFDLNFRIASDYDWMLRAVELYGNKISLIDHTMMDMMYGGASTSGIRTYLRHNLEALQSRRQHLGVARLDYALLAKPGRKIRQFFY
ncbi:MULTISPECIES: glycosyltransferase family 2 protein [unclassified Mesorhizobium]|uniref:glycosyltransferase family 2 protein n=1 Tax=unclassified Mesorhizobium TaxID=325217 RepID=UPI000FD251F0|nr:MULTISPECIES: glycosyltransferase family 2 protein [unclassified Mesorhizobium]RVB80576.1 glycosyltransferase [Mesorhizobium sp. M6A.T.Cr.TU.014.01.1.1]RWP97565.1 MAG: glycosyltransferase [Mesorhizobium sp.]RWQ10838.1 MAG: glycosyltransferase [Mesorhizobium sp.]